MAAVAAFATTACTTGATATGPVPVGVEVEVVYSHFLCLDAESPAVRRIDTEPALEALTRPGAPLAAGGSTAERLRLPAPATGWLLRIGMGRRPSTGHSIHVLRADRAQAVLTVHVDWQEPAPGMASAQMVTHPCVVLRLAPMDVKRVRVVDSSGRVRADVTLGTG